MGGGRATLASPGGGGTASTFLGGKSTTSLAGWNHLNVAWAETLPTNLAAARGMRRAALRELSGLRKVSR